MAQSLLCLPTLDFVKTHGKWPKRCGCSPYQPPGGILGAPIFHRLRLGLELARLIFSQFGWLTTSDMEMARYGGGCWSGYEEVGQSTSLIS